MWLLEEPEDASCYYMDLFLTDTSGDDVGAKCNAVFVASTLK